MRKFLMSIWEASVGAGITFGPLFMTNIGGSARPTEWMSFAGVVMLSLALVWMSWTLKMQRAEIDQLKKERLCNKQ